MPSVGRAAKDSTSQDDRRVGQKVTNLNGSSEVRALSVGSDGRWAPGFRAMRVEPGSPRHGTAAADAAQEPIPPTLGRPSTARRGGCLERGAAAMSSMGYEATARSSAPSAEFEVASSVEPWKMMPYMNPGRGKDSWDLLLWTAGWLIASTVSPTAGGAITVSPTLRAQNSLAFVSSLFFKPFTTPASPPLRCSQPPEADKPLHRMWMVLRGD